MSQTTTEFARSQADGYDNIAPTTLQGQQAWQYAQSDNFFSSEEQTAVMRRQLEPYQGQIEAKLARIGYPPDHLATLPGIQSALYSGQKTEPMTVTVGPNLTLTGSLRVVMTESGPDLRIIPVQERLVIPEQVGGVQLSKADQQQLRQEGALQRPLLMAQNGEYVPTYLRVDTTTNTIELWRLKAEELPTRLMGIDLTRDQQMQIAGGHAVRLTGLRDLQGEPFNATVSVSPAKQALQFSDLSRLDVILKPDGEHRHQLAHNNEGAKTDLTRSREAAIGSPAISNQQVQAIKEFLDKEPAGPERSTKINR